MHPCLAMMIFARVMVRFMLPARPAATRARLEG